MGDIVMSSHLAAGLRSKFPEARICWLAEPQVAPLLEHNPALDSVFIWHKTQWKELLRTRQWGRLLREIRTFTAKLRAEQFSLVVDVQGLFRTRLLAWLSGAKERIGFTSREPGKALMTRLVSKGDDNRLMGSEYFYMLQQLGVATTQLKQAVHLAPEAFAEAAAVLKSAGTPAPYVVFAPFTTRPQKHWFEDAWIELARMVARDLGFSVVWLGGPTDKPPSAALAAQGGGVSLAGATSLAVSAAIVAQASLVIGVDTGLTHMGSAFGVPTIALFGATCPYSKTCSDQTIVMYHPLPCSPCRRSPVCDGRFDCMQAITVSEVMQIAVSLLAPEDRR